MPPDYIIDNWTDELLDLMTEKLAERRQREMQAVSPVSSESSGGHKISDKEFFRHVGHLVKVIKKKGA